MNYRLKILLLLLIGMLFQAGCGTDAAYTEESFSSDSPFKLRVDSDIEAACESARRSLLGQGYLIDTASSEEVKGRKAARVEGKQNAFIEMTVVCVPERGGSTIFATGVLSTYDMKTNTSSASVGVSAIGSISLPIGQSVDSLVKVSEQTIDDKEFYKRFFSAVETILGEMRIRETADDPATEPVQESATQEASQPVNQPRIWPELFPEQATSATVPQPAAGQVVPEVVPAPTPAPVPEPTPQQVAPLVTPAALPTNTGPATIAEPVPQQPVPAPATEPLPQTEPAVIPAAPVPNEAPRDIAPLGIPPTPAAAEAPVAVAPEVASSPTASAPAGPELAPIEVTVAKKVAPKPVAEEPAAPAPAVVPQNPATKMDGLF
jgi:hypothetical protein